MNKYLALALGGAAGSLLRYWVGLAISQRVSTNFPLGTFIINITGSFVIGFFLALGADRLNLSPSLRLGLTVGFVGAYTTFSTFEFETLQLIKMEAVLQAMLYVVLSCVLGLLAVWGGMLLGQKI